MLQVISDDKDEEEEDEGKGVSEGSGDHKGDGSSSSSGSSDSDDGGGDDDDEDEDVEVEDSRNPHTVDSAELGWRGVWLVKTKKLTFVPRMLVRCRAVILSMLCVKDRRLTLMMMMMGVMLGSGRLARLAMAVGAFCQC